MIMAVSPKKSACLDLTISVPGSYTSSLSLNRSSGDEGGTVTMRDLDINQMPSEIGEDDQWTTGSMDLEEDDNLININNGEGAKGPPRKKLRLTKEQSRLLEESFRHNHTLNPKQKETLAMELKLKPRQVEVWFQNRRARSKLKQTEMECEYLKRWFGSLTEQNRRLQKELEELRAMKVGPPTVMTPHSCDPLLASTLTMCPQCERVTSTGHDKGPTRTTTTTAAAATAPTNPTTLSAKVAVAHSRHPSAAC